MVAAAALRRRGFGVEVFERAGSVRSRGTGIALWTNATAVLRGLGLLDLLDGIAEPMERMVVLSGCGGSSRYRRRADPARDVYSGLVLKIGDYTYALSPPANGQLTLIA